MDDGRGVGCAGILLMMALQYSLFVGLTILASTPGTLVSYKAEFFGLQAWKFGIFAVLCVIATFVADAVRGFEEKHAWPKVNPMWLPISFFACGWGFYSLHELSKGWQAVLIEISVEDMERAQEKAEAAKKARERRFSQSSGDLNRLQGTWKCARMETRGEPIPEEEWKDILFTVNGDEYSMARQGNRLFVGGVELKKDYIHHDGGNIDLLSSDEALKDKILYYGTYRFKQDMFEFCYCPYKGAGAGRIPS